MDTLTVDPQKVNVAMAEKYLRDHNNFKDWPDHGKFWLINRYPDVGGRTECNFTAEEITGIEKTKFQDMPAYVGSELSKKIKSNAKLFSQLEYVIRKTEAVDVENNIELMTQHLQCTTAVWTPGLVGRKLGIIVTEDTPLYALGCVAAALYENLLDVNIVATKKMAPLCLLFVQLCQELKWTIPLIFVDDVESYQACTDLDIINKSREYGCTGVVTESADVDSALDFFINTSITAPWRLQRIFVQESIYDEVRGALASRTTRVNVNGCGDAFIVKDKTFLFDSLLGAEDKTSLEQRCVTVEGYRTAKELRALVGPSLCASVWGADRQHCAEVALSCPASYVWLDDCASFPGPPQASLPVYHALYPLVTHRLGATLPDNFNALVTDWKKLTQMERVKSVTETLNSGLCLFRDGPKSTVTRLQQAVHENESFADVNDGQIVYGVERKISEGYVPMLITEDEDLCRMLKLAIRGVAVEYLFRGLDDSDVKELLLDALRGAGVPITPAVDFTSGTRCMKHSLLLNTLKVISSNFGTIFAN